ncbi:hypothetical protein MRX96_011927 [Rhipicephalus microplus]
MGPTSTQTNIGNVESGSRQPRSAGGEGGGGMTHKSTRRPQRRHHRGEAQNLITVVQRRSLNSLQLLAGVIAALLRRESAPVVYRYLSRAPHTTTG